MNAQNKIEELQREIERLKSVQRTCKHECKEARYDPEEIMVSDDRSGCKPDIFAMTYEPA